MDPLVAQPAMPHLGHARGVRCAIAGGERASEQHGCGKAEGRPAMIAKPTTYQGGQGRYESREDERERTKRGGRPGAPAGVCVRVLCVGRGRRGRPRENGRERRRETESVQRGKRRRRAGRGKIGPRTPVTHLGPREVLTLLRRRLPRRTRQQREGEGRSGDAPDWENVGWVLAEVIRGPAEK